MGYDMYVVDREGNTVDEAGIGDYDPQDEASIDAAFERQAAAHCYLRRAMGSMGALRQALIDTNEMGYYAAGEPEFPKEPEDTGNGVEIIPGFRDHEHFNDHGEPLTDEAREYQAEVQRVLRRTYDERPGIPVHKLASNDGWWVTHHECASALKLWEQAGSPMPDAFRDDVIPFLTNAAAKGGFRVY